MSQSCDPQALASASTCFHCLPDPKAVKTYLLCQWAGKPVAPSCSPPSVVLTMPDSPDDQCIFVHVTSTRDPLVRFDLYFGTTPGGPYNAPGSPRSEGKTLRDFAICTTDVPPIIALTTYYIVIVAVDSDTCQSAQSNEVNGATI